MSAVAAAGCSECSWIAPQLAAGESYTCRACSVRHERPRPKRVRVPRVVVDVTERDVRAFVHDVLTYATSIERIESASGVSTSTWLLGVIESNDGRLWRGSGNRGTKGVGAAPKYDAPPAKLDPLLHARYLSLRGGALLTADAVAADGQGDRVVDMPFARRDPISMTLAQRVGFRLARQTVVDKWIEQINERHSAPMLAGSAEIGADALTVATKAWFSR